MKRTKVQLPASSATVETAARPVLRSAAAPAPKAAPKPAPKAAPTSAETKQVEVNHTADFVAAGIVPHGKPSAAGRVELVGPGAMYSPPPGNELRAFIHRDGSAVKFAGAAGEIFLDRGEAHSELGSLVASALGLLAGTAAPQRDVKPKAPPPAPKAAPPKTPVRRAAESSSVSDSAPTAVSRAAETSSGVPLPASSRTKLESSYGADLGAVRVHTDSAASEAAKSVSAHAFTTGQDIYFRSGQYNPGTPGGQKLLAHEVAHTVQQQSAPSTVAKQSDAPDLQISEPGERIEREADAAADRAMKGQTVALGTSRPTIARLADGPPPAAPAGPAPAPKAETPKADAGPKAPAGGGAAAAPAGPPPAGGPAPAKAGPVPEAGSKAEAKAPAGGGGGIDAVKVEVGAAGDKQKEHGDPQKKADEAKDSVGVTADQAAAEEKKKQVDGMAAKKPLTFDKAKFKAALQAKIQGLQADKAKEIHDGDQAQATNDIVKGQVAEGKAAAAGPVAEAAKADAPAGNAVQGPQLPAAEAGKVPAVDASKAVPGKVPDENVTLAPQSAAIDSQMADANVTDEQLKKSNEPQFTGAAAEKDKAQTQAAAVPDQARAAEEKTLTKAKVEANQTTQAGLAGMHGQRAEALNQTLGQQTAGKGQHEELKKRVAAKLDPIYSRTKTAVDDRLKLLDKQVDDEFSSGAMWAKTKFYGVIGTKILIYYVSGGWLADAITGENSRDKIFIDCRADYMKDMDEVIDRVAGIVADGLNEVVAIVAKGKAELDEEMAKLPQEEQEVGREVAQGIQTKFADLEKSIADKQTAIIDGLAEKVVAAQKDVDSAISFLKDPVGGLIDMAIGAIKDVIETIKKMKALLLGILAKAGEAIDLILADPIGFVMNLVAGVKQGLNNFGSNIATHLKNGFFAWLFGAIGEAGIQMPDTFDLKGVMSIALQVLGLTWANIRKRAVAIVGEPVVKALETASEIVMTLINKGVSGLWEYLKEKATDLIQQVIDGIKSFLIEKVIMGGIQWIIGLMNPASAFVKACLAIIDIIQWIVTNGSQIVEFVNAVVDSVLSIAKGNIVPAAAAVEKALAKSIPVAIGFLASLLKLGGLSKAIKENIEKIQAPINAAIDWLINKAVALAKKVAGIFGGGNEKNKKDSGKGEGHVEESFTLNNGETHTLSYDIHDAHNVLILASKDPKNAPDQFKDVSKKANAKDNTPLDKALAKFDNYRAKRKALEEKNKKGNEPISRLKQEHSDLLKKAAPEFKIAYDEIMAAGGRIGSAPGVGKTGAHSSNVSSLRKGGVKVWELESEHIIPRTIFDRTVMFLSDGAIKIPRRGGTYESMTTVVIYRQAAKNKTRGSDVGSWTIIWNLIDKLRADMKAGKTKEAAEDELIGAVVNAFNVANTATKAAIRAELELLDDDTKRKHKEIRGNQKTNEDEDKTLNLDANVDQAASDEILHVNSLFK